MTTSQAAIASSEDWVETPIDRFRLHYMGAAARHAAHECVQVAFEKSGISKADLAARLGWDASRVGRLLNTPANITIETLGELLYAIDGGCLYLDQVWPDRARANNCELEWLTVQARAYTPIVAARKSPASTNSTGTFRVLEEV
jgi:hypothetical protein